MTKVQEGLLELLLEIDQLCKENDIEYCLGGGCLMGAVRSGCFLPWDDDADVHMTRENAERFYNLKDKFKHNRAMYTVKDYPDFLFPNVYRYVDLESTAQATRQIMMGHPTGQFIDIIILDDAPTSPEDQAKQAEALGYYLELHTKNGTISSNRPSEFFTNYFKYEEKCKEGHEEEIIGRFKNIVYSPAYKDGEYYLVGTGIAPNPFLPRHFFDSFKYIDFEDVQLPVPEKSEELLRYAYGSTWMYAPPVSEENVHTFLLDQDIPFSVIDRDHERFINKEDYYKLCCEDKHAWFMTQQERQIVNKEIRQVKGVMQRLLAYHGVNRNADTVDDLANLDKKKLYNIFKQYYDFQFSETSRFWGIFEPLNDDILYYALLAMIESSDYSKCYKLINMRKDKVNKPLTPEILALEERCETIQRCVDLYYVDKDYEACREEVTLGLEKYEDDVNLLRLKIKLLHMKAEKEGSWDEFYSELSRIMEIYPGDGEFIFYTAEKEEKEGSIINAKDLYKKAYDGTRNGFVLAASDGKITEIDNFLSTYTPEVDENYIKKLSPEEGKKWRAAIDNALGLYYVEKDFDACREAAEEGLKLYPDEINLDRLLLRLLAREAKETEEYDELNEAIQRMLKTHPDDGQILVYEANRKVREAHLVSAKKDFLKVTETTDNLYDLHTANKNIERIEGFVESLRPDPGYFRGLYEKEQKENEAQAELESEALVAADNSEEDYLEGSDSVSESMDSIDFIDESNEQEIIEDPEVLIVQEEEDKNVIDDAGDSASDSIEEEVILSDEEILDIYGERQALINECIDLLYRDLDHEKCVERANYGLSLYPEDIYLLRLRLHAMNLGSKGSEDKEKVIEEANRLHELFPRDGEINKYLADEILEKGYEIEAMRRYRAAFKSTGNRIVRSDINQQIRTIKKKYESYIPEDDMGYLNSYDKNETEALAEIIRRCKELYYVERDFEACRAELDEALENYPDEKNLRLLNLRMLAKEAKTAGDFRPLEDEIDRLAAIYPEEGQVLIYDALRNYRKGRFKKAREIFSQVLNTTSNVYDVNTAVKQIEVIDRVWEALKPPAGHYEGLYREEMGVNLDPDVKISQEEILDIFASRKELIDRATELFYVEEDFSACEKVVDEGLEKYPEERHLLRLKVKLEEIRKAEGFSPSLEKALELYPADGEFTKYYGDLAYSQGSIFEARRKYADAFKKTKNRIVRLSITEKLRNLRDEIASYTPPIVENSMSLSDDLKETIKACQERYYIEEDFDGCRKLMDEAINAYPDEINLECLDLGLMAKNTKTPNEYEKLDLRIGELLEKYPDEGQILVYEGLRRMREGDIVSAKETFLRVIDTTRNAIDINTAKYNIERIDKIIQGLKPTARYYARTYYEDSFRTFTKERMEEEFGERAAEVGEAVELFYVGRDYEKAREMVESCLEKYPDDPYLHRIKIKLLHMGGGKEFKVELEKAIQLYPDDGEFTFYLAEKAEEKKNYSAAASLYMKSLETTGNYFTKRLIRDRIEGLKKKNPEAVIIDNSKQGQLDPHKARKYMFRTLLKEVISICEESDIKYFVVDDALRLLLRGKPIENNLREVAVVMLKPDFDRFKEIVEAKNRPNREIEGIFNNPTMPGLHYRYVATNTLFLNLSYLHGYKKLGYSISIYVPIEDKDDVNIRKKVARAERKTRANIYNKYYNAREKKIIRNAKITKSLSGEKGYVKMIESVISENALTDPSKRSHIVFVNGNRVWLPEGFFSESQRVETDDLNFNTVKDIDRYLELRYGLPPEEALEQRPMRIAFDFFCHTGIKYEDFFAELKKDNLFSDYFFDKRQKHMALTREYRKYDTVKRETIELWRRDGERFKLWKYYMPIKDSILKLHSEGDYEELARVLRYYLKDLRYYQKKNLGICFDYDILQIALEVLENSEKYNVTEWELQQMVELIPEEHLHEDIGEFIEKYAPEGYKYELHEVEWKDL